MILSRFSISQNTLKIIAAISMVIDHLGAEVFPGIVIFRVLGRLAFPIFSYCIYEGCRYTHHKVKYLLGMIIMALVYLIVYALYAHRLYGNIFFTLALSICVIYAIRFWKKKSHESFARGCFGFVVFTVTALLACAISVMLSVDYGFCGVMLPVFLEVASDFTENRNLSPRLCQRIMLLSFAIGLCFLALEKTYVQWFGLLALVPLSFYDGSRGKWHMKFFFYLFYPAHMALIELIAVLV